MEDALFAEDLGLFFDIINRIYAQIPSELHSQKESYYHSIFIAACGMASLCLEAESPSSLGRSDAVLTTPKAIYVIEFKIDSTPELAIAQIVGKRYCERHAGQGKPVIPVGVVFGLKERKIVGWKAAS